MNTRILYSQTYDPWFNLATEEWIFNDMAPEAHVLYLWSNDETVVIGRCQNPWVECRLDLMERDGVRLARRQSGGGAVFHDKKNLNFTFMSGLDDYSVERNFEIIRAALDRFGIPAEVTGRNDLIVGGRKISGSAFKKNKDLAFHHGTLLIDTDLVKLSSYLNPDPRKLEAKGVKSVKSRVANLVEINPRITAEGLRDALADEFAGRLGTGEEISLGTDSLGDIPELVGYYERLKSREWLYGRTPPFTHSFDQRFPWGGVEIRLDVRKGRIHDALIHSDCLYPEMILALAENLRGADYASPSVGLALKRTGDLNRDWRPCLKDIRGILL